MVVVSVLDSVQNKHLCRCLFKDTKFSAEFSIFAEPF